MRKILLKTMMAISCCHSLAQVPLTHVHNGMRSGDVLYKIVVDYVNEGGTGHDAVWTLGRVTEASKVSLQTNVSAGDTIAILEKDGIRHYLMHGDTLFFKGHQARHSYILYDRERPVLSYPFQYGDSISGYFDGQGRDENHNVYLSGWGYSVIDGTGMLTDGEDTLRNVTRVHLFDEYVEQFGPVTSVNFRCHRYLWYCAGYRYPVMESFKRIYIEGGTVEVPMDSVTYLYLPDQQETLGRDAANDSIRSQLSQDVGWVACSDSDNSPLTLTGADISSDGRSVAVSFALSEDCEVTIRACDILGCMLGMLHESNKKAGEWHERMALSRRPIGHVLMLNIDCNGNTSSHKICY